MNRLAVVHRALLGVVALGFFVSTSAQESRMAPGPVHQPNLAVGEPAPDFELQSLDGETFRLADQRGERPILLLFFRGTW